MDDVRKYGRQKFIITYCVIRVIKSHQYPAVKTVKCQKEVHIGSILSLKHFETENYSHLLELRRAGLSFFPKISFPNYNNNNNLFNVYTYNGRPYILIFNFVILYNTRIYVRVTLSRRAVSETDRVPFILTVLFALHLH